MKSNTSNIIFTLLIGIIVMTLFMAIGYTTVSNVNLGISGTVSTADFSKIFISNVELVNNSSTITSNTFNFSDTHIDFNLKYRVTKSNYTTGFNSTYKITITNDTLIDHVLTSNILNYNINSSNKNMSLSYDLDGIKLGDIIPAKSSVDFNLIINLYPIAEGEFDVSITDDITFDIDNTGIIIGNIPENSVGDLRNNEIVKFSAAVMNTYKMEKQFNFSLGNDNFMIVDENGNPLENMTIGANDTRDYDFYIKLNDGVRFPTDTQKVNIYINPVDEEKSNMGVITLLVDKDPTMTDDEPPIVSDVIATIESPLTTGEKGCILVKWSGSDNVGIDHYVLNVYNENNNLIGTYTTEKDEYTVKGLIDGKYYFEVIAYDGSGNYVSKTNLLDEFIWNFTVSYNLTHATSTGSNSDIVDYDGIYEVTLSGEGRESHLFYTVIYDTPSSITVKMGGKTLTNGSDYEYSSSGNLVIKNVRGNIEITATGTRTATCLAKGTNILLANGKTKKIEDIGYDDLLAVWNYDTGKLTYEYPLWIENEHYSDEYTRITFSDDTYLDIVGNHALYNTDINLFVNLNDIDYFKEGSHIAKIDKSGDLYSVSIKSIETKKQDITYYFVGTTTYYNVIANNVLTTDSNTLISNLYGFEENAKWPITKDIIVSDERNILDYSKFEDILPYYLYKGFRAGESGYLIRNNIIDLNSFKTYITTLIVNPKMLKSPITKNTKRYWMVTTDLDNLDDSNKSNYLYEEGTNYILPNIDGVKYWYSTSDNKLYLPGENIKVYHGMHFIAKR